MNIKIFTNNIEPQAMNQVYELARLDAFKDCKIRIMPDVHAGAGCVVGFTADLGEKIIPNIVGVDIGCGMLCVKLGQVDDLDLARFDDIVNKYIPSGRAIRDKAVASFEFQKLHCMRVLTMKCLGNADKSIGTLGGGNHFIELDKDNEDNIYLVIHTGSRNLGKQVAETYQNLAIQYCQENQHLDIPKDLCYLEGDYRKSYLHDMKLCQEYATLNRQTIAQVILSKYFGADYKRHIQESFTTIHNYINFNDNIVRKGAISARAGEKVIIPMNMRDGSIIAIGKGNEDWNYSAPHGAGRILSRSAAKREVNYRDFVNTMQGIYSTSVREDTVDESPFVYKPMGEIIDNIRDTVDITTIIRPIYNFKA